MRSRLITTRVKTRPWTLGLFIAGTAWILLAPVVGHLNPFLLIGCIVLSLVVDCLTGKLFDKGVYIE